MIGVSGSNEGMKRGPGMAVDKDSTVPLHKHYDGAKGARHKHCMQLQREYGLLVLQDLAGDLDTAGAQVRAVGHGATREKDNQG